MTDRLQCRFFFNFQVFEYSRGVELVGNVFGLLVVSYSESLKTKKSLYLQYLLP